MTRYLGKGLEGPLRGSTGDGTGPGRRAASETSFPELVEVDGEVPSLESASYVCSTSWMWEVTFRGTEGQLDHDATMGHVFNPDGEPEAVLQEYLENTRLPDGLYGLNDDAGHAVLVEFTFRRQRPLPPVRSLRPVR